MTTEIHYAATDHERQEVRDFLAEHITGIAPNAVPSGPCLKLADGSPS